jgi:SAM-dependent methyltransferase
VECKKCGLSFTNPRPDINEINKYYSLNYSFYNNYNFLKKFYHSCIYFLVNSIFFFIIYFIPFFKNKSKLFIRSNKIKNPINVFKDCFFLDIGSGSGVSSHWWGAKGSLAYYKKITKNIFAVEPSLECQKSLSNIGANSFLKLEDIEENIFFDVIRMNWSLEHVHNPQKYFNFISKRLKKNGEAVICIPNFSGEIYQIDKSISELPIHLYHFKYKNIKDYCKKNNLGIKYFETFSYASMYYQASLINKNFKRFGEMSISELKELQKNFDKNQNKELGNDMIFKLVKI